MPKQRHQDDDDDDFDPRILKDGETYRVPLRMMDSVSRAVAGHVKHQVHIADHLGNADLGLCRPGFRKIDGGNEGDQILRDGEARDRAEVYQDYERDLTDAWKTDAWGSQNVGDVCMTNSKKPGHIKMVNGAPTCVADNASYAVTDIKDNAIAAAAAYDSYATDYLEEEWKKGNR